MDREAASGRSNGRFLSEHDFQVSTCCNSMLGVMLQLSLAFAVMRASVSAATCTRLVMHVRRSCANNWPCCSLVMQ